MIDLARAEFGFEDSQCFVVGDKPCDVDLGRRMGATTFLVRTGHGQHYVLEGKVKPDHIVNDLHEAGQIIERLLDSDEAISR